ncbi:C13 family peptidase [Dyella sp.]|uniref:C13 family peptidase n=1 Tax=Dyella sp. TaxID=1869338 RepID=UPI002D76DB3B|nr:C13 family peptidase [Dyella sp.]HET6433475.1 C13 family peptidase [Dyella sp.]
MRLLLTALLAFATGAALTATVAHQSPPSAVLVPHPPATAATAVKTAADAEPVDTPPDRWPVDAPSPEQVLYAQPRLLRRALDQLTPPVAGVPNLYLVTFAGDGSEDVFRNEAEYAARLFEQRYGRRAHSVVLANNPATLDTLPLASWSNLENLLTALSRVMDPRRDILMLYLTSHGDPEHNLLVDMDPLPLDQIGARDLAGILEEHPFKWKVVVVNACYSGGFVSPLQGDGTLVMTAARSDRSSFGCGSDSDATYFGRAWLVDALNRTPDPVQAFRDASAEVARWESRDHLTPSEPQIAVGAGIEQQLSKWRAGIRAGSPLPFRPGERTGAPATQ